MVGIVAVYFFILELVVYLPEPKSVPVKKLCQIEAIKDIGYFIHVSI